MATGSKTTGTSEVCVTAAGSTDAAAATGVSVTSEVCTTTAGSTDAAAATTALGKERKFQL